MIKTERDRVPEPEQTNHSLKTLPTGAALQEALFASLVDGVIYQDFGGKVVFSNPAANRLLSRELTAVDSLRLDDSYWRFFDRDNKPISSSLTLAEYVIQSRGNSPYSVLGVVRGEGDCVWLRLHAQQIEMADASYPPGTLLSFIDITEETLAKRELEVTSERLRLALDGASIGIWDWYLQSDEMIWDDQMYRLYGLEPDDKVPARQVWESAAHPDDNKRVLDELLDMARASRECVSEFRVTLPDKSTRHLRAYARAVVGEDGRVERVVGMNWDITKEAEAEDKLARIAFNDELTGLPNRAGFNNRLRSTLARAKVLGSQVAVLVMDLDHFKNVNDSYGHPVGDSLIIEVVNRLRHVLAGNEHLARIGGDEFALILENIKTVDAAERYSKRLQRALEEPIYLVEGPAVNTRISLGVSIFPEDGENAVELVKAADLAMHQAKNAGRNKMVRYDPGFSSALHRKIHLEEELRNAIRDEELKLYYQPIIDLSNEKVVGCEALLRWVDNKGQFVSPADFVPVAEESGLIYELGNWTNATAFKQLKLWKAINTDLKYVSVNVSPHQLQNPAFVTDIAAMVEMYGVDPGDIQLEITEGTFLQESLNARSQLRTLGDMGFRLAIDDFGTGYSSLAYLKRFDVDVIKIDRSFVNELEQDPVDRDIVKAILAMTDSLGFDTLVEGVETREQALIVGALGCGYAQGYLYGRPTFADEFAEKYIGVGNSN